MFVKIEAHWIFCVKIAWCDYYCWSVHSNEKLMTLHISRLWKRTTIALGSSELEILLSNILLVEVTNLFQINIIMMFSFKTIQDSYIAWNYRKVNVETLRANEISSMILHRRIHKANQTLWQWARFIRKTHEPTWGNIIMLRRECFLISWTVLKRAITQYTEGERAANASDFRKANTQTHAHTDLENFISETPLAVAFHDNFIQSWIDWRTLFNFKTEKSFEK